MHVQSVKLLDGDNIFDLSIPLQELAFSWLRVHPTIASSYQAWERGEYPAETQFFVADEEIEKRGMGTTLTALLIRDNRIALLHVGDSRCYRLRGNTLEQLSNDHTVIQELLDQGAISQAEAADHPQRSMLTQALRGDGDVTPVLQMYEVKKGDRYLLCSDGLSGVLTDKEIKVGLKKSDKDEAVKFLNDATYINGAPDNVTILIADISDKSTTSSILLGAAHD